MPHLNKYFSEGKFTFTNAFNGLGWTGLFSVTREEINGNWFVDNGYRAAGLSVNNQMYLIPLRNSWRKDADGKLPNSNFEKNYRETLDSFVESLPADSTRPYFMMAHIKYAHFPLIDRFNADSGWDQFLLPEEKLRVNRYLKSPKKFAAKLPFLLMLTNDSKLLRAHPLLYRTMSDRAEGGHDAAFLGLLNAPKFLRAWKASADYEIDVTILKKIYRANVLYLDKIIGELLSRLEGRGALKNTVVIFAGDHGEVHMERDHLTHGTSWFDPALRVPIMLRFPQQNESVTIDWQTNFFSLTALIKGIGSGLIDVGNFFDFVKTYRDPVLIARDCANTWRALRHNNQWKYVVDNASGETWLFDLIKDPGETNNLATEKPELVAEMEALYWQKLPNYTAQEVNSCAPSP